MNKPLESNGLIDEQYKDASPLKTVERIRAILHSYGLETTEKWWESNVPNCFSLSVNIKGTSFSTHGKGLTKEFTLASAYGELMERLQLGYIGNAETQKNGQLFTADSICRRVSVEELLKERTWYEKMAEKHLLATGKSFTPEQILAQFVEEDGKVSAIPLFNLTRNCHTFFPEKIRKAVYCSNGCAAGNTIEEAVVQAIGEIVERDHKLTILSKGISVPDIPDEVLQNFKTAYRIICYLRENGLQVTVKDCSLGTRFPVVCVCYINKETGRYHTHFGANPILEIALERALTESFQGITLQSFVSIDSFTYDSQETMSAQNLNKELVYGVAQKTPEFFIEKSQESWNSQMGFSGKSNPELLKELIDFFEQQNCEILVQDGSCLGFPTCRVMIPGRSEILIHRLNQDNYEFRYAEYAMNAFRNPASASIDDYFGLLMHMQEIRTVPKNHDKTLFCSHARLSAVLEPAENDFLQAATLGYIYYAMGRQADALNYVKQMIASAKPEIVGELICLRRYLELGANGYSPDKIRAVLTYFHQPQTVQAFYDIIENGNPFSPYVLHCNKECSESCQLYGKCGQLKVDQMLKIIATKTGELDFESFVNYLKSFLIR